MEEFEVLPDIHTWSHYRYPPTEIICCDLRNIQLALPHFLNTAEPYCCTNFHAQRSYLCFILETAKRIRHTM